MCLLRWQCVAAVAACVVAASALSAQTDPADRLPTVRAGAPSQERSFVRVVEKPQERYDVTHGGTADGESSRYPMGVLAPPQAFESNLSVEIANIGDTDVVNPWLSNHRTTVRSSADFIGQTLRPGMTDKEKAIAIWQKFLSLRFHGDAFDEEDVPMRVFNAYGFNTCGGAAAILMQLWRLADLESRMNLLPFHVVAEVKYDGGWHVLDGDLAAMYLLRDNATVASFYQLAGDHDLIRRAHSYGLLEPEQGNSKHTAPLYSLGRLFTVRGRHLSHDDMHLNYWIKSVDRTIRYGAMDLNDSHEMDMTLRPGERLRYTWEPVRADRMVGAGLTNPNAARLVTRGEWIYQPDLTSSVWPRGVEAIEGVSQSDGRLVSATGGHIVWRLRSPYPFFEARVDASGHGVRWQISRDGTAWIDATPGSAQPLPDARYQPARSLLVRARFDAGAVLTTAALSAGFQTARVALPSMRVGPNRFTIEQQGQGRLRVTHKWIEDSSNQPPLAPTLRQPSKGDTRIASSRLAFVWSPAADPDGDRIVDYHLQLSEYPDMRWPASPTFDRLTSRMGTLDGSVATMVFPRLGLLRTDTKYYWRVRARDEKGFWGPWSQPSSFKTRAPLPPDVTIAVDPATRVGVLRWQPRRGGTAAVRYEVHGSNMPGFTADATTLLATTERTSMAVLGPASAPNLAFYRVISYDKDDSRSPASEVASAPRPFIHSVPAAVIDAGTAYEYRPASIVSQGIEGRYDSQGTAYWDQDDVEWSVVQAPEWLSFEDGILTGRPSDPGRYDVTIRATSVSSGIDSLSFSIVVKEGAPVQPSRAVQQESCTADVAPVVRRFYDLLSGAGSAADLRAMIADEFAARIDRGGLGERFLMAAMADLQERHREFGPITALSITPLACSDQRVDLLAAISYRQRASAVRDRLTVVRPADRWLIGRPR
ncbi:MAG TPA: putative Ig domain-containing protein [Vicinamibacterales bacterium]|nr:putative Ig domain-containing protein [Vicinamibacterales bacterium]